MTYSFLPSLFKRELSAASAGRLARLVQLSAIKSLLIPARSSLLLSPGESRLICLFEGTEFRLILNYLCCAKLLEEGSKPLFSNYEMAGYLKLFRLEVGKKICSLFKLTGSAWLGNLFAPPFS